MKKHAGVIVSMCLALAMLTAQAAEEHQAEMDAAVAAAEAWLKLVDDGQYDASWDQSADYVKGVVKKEQWAQSMQGARQPLGALLSRKVTSSSYRTTLPGAPDGQYVVIQFETSFANKKEAVETVTPMLQEDGKWYVSGYYIR